MNFVGRSIRLLLASLLLTSGSVGCDKAKEARRLLDSEATTPSTSPTATSSAPIALKITSLYDQTSYVNTLKFTDGKDTCQVSKTNPTVVCEMKIDEARLHYSKIDFNISWMPSECTLLNFKPYLYQFSKSATFKPDWSDAVIDCSATPIPDACFGGAGSQMITDLYKYNRLIFFPDEKSATKPMTAVKSVASSFSLKRNSNRLIANDLGTRTYAANPLNSFNLLTNRSTVNATKEFKEKCDAADATCPAAVTTPLDFGYPASAFDGDGMVAGSFQDYEFYCDDGNFESIPYNMKIIITDSNNLPSFFQTTTPKTYEDHFPTWANQPYTTYVSP